VQTAAYWTAAHTRTYWFISQWQWYEWVGLIGPLVLLSLLWCCAGRSVNETSRVLTAMTIAAGSLAIAVALFFARMPGPNEFVARLQPLRIFQMIYVLMLIAAGASLAETFLRRRAWYWAIFMLSLGSGMFYVQRATYPASRHLELPWTGPVNLWEQGFLWIRSNTPENALFALDANYITAAGEDAQNFRAIARRSALPDYSKDGGAAAIAPDLAATWRIGQGLQSHLNEKIGREQLAKLRGTGVDWVVLSSKTATPFGCLYTNAAIKVCRIQ
jgi:hypothetical protein